MFIKRKLTKRFSYLLKKFPVITLTGPRQSGKTTFLKAVCKNYKYVSLEDPDTRSFALTDPRGFLEKYNNKIIIDEAQYSPQLFSYIQSYVDKSGSSGQFILSGSQNFLLHNKISQSLAGRSAVLKLFPFSLIEIYKKTFKNLYKTLFNGFYPGIYDKHISPTDYFPSYIQTYIERDVRQLVNISDLNTFQKFVKLCAGRTGQIINYSSLGNDCGITSNTAKSWLSILEASYIVFLLPPFYNNFNKRIIKSPKIYFWDTGLLCSILGIQSEDHLFNHFLRGSIFESFVISEIYKHKYNEVSNPACYFLRDKVGNEIDCLFENYPNTFYIEIKSGKTISEEYFKGLSFWNKLTGSQNINSYVIYGGMDTQQRLHGSIIPWNKINKIFK